METVDSRRLRSMRWPRPKAGDPARSRPVSAARTATAPSMPVVRSEIARPTFVGAPGAGQRPGTDRDDEVVAGSVGQRAVGAVAGDRKADQAWVEPLELVVREAQPLQPPDPVILDGDVA